MGVLHGLYEGIFGCGEGEEKMREPFFFSVGKNESTE